MNHTKLIARIKVLEDRTWVLKYLDGLFREIITNRIPFELRKRAAKAKGEAKAEADAKLEKMRASLAASLSDAAEKNG